MRSRGRRACVCTCFTEMKPLDRLVNLSPGPLWRPDCRTTVTPGQTNLAGNVFHSICLSVPHLVHSSPLPPPIDASAPWGHAMLAEALCCERVLSLPSIWVSYRGRRFKRSSPLHAVTGCASTRADYPCWSVRACKCVCDGVDVCVHM